MKEKIYTIPVNEAFDKDGECAFCEMMKKLDADILDYILGPSYMEEDIREETDKSGFCKYHYDKMFHAQNRLGVALMVSTHLKKINKDLPEILNSEFPKKSVFKKDLPNPLANYHEVLSNDCYACKRIQVRMNSYIETFFYLWKREEDFRNKVMESKGFCLDHFCMLLDQGRKRMNNKDFTAFREALIPIQLKNMERLDEELDWFIQKFDYRFTNEPWKNSKDSLERAILKISSTILEP